MLRRVLFIVLIASFPSCTRRPGTDVSAPRSKPTVYVINYPLQYFSVRIGGDFVDVRFPAPGDEDPAFWRPSADVIAAYQSADLILLNGAGYAKWVALTSLPESRTVDTSDGFLDQLILTRGAVTHGHGPQGEHSHAGTAFTTWIDFDQALQQAIAVKDALNELLPDHGEQITANFSSLSEDLSALDASMREVAEQIGDRPLAASHPVYQYLSRRYALNIRAVHWEPVVVPDDAAIDELAKILAEHPAKRMIWEGPPDPQSIDKLALMGVASAVFNPCGNRPPEQGTDWLAVMRKNIRDLNDAIGEGSN